MLGKLLKYDTKSLSKLIFPISLIALLATGMGCGLIAFSNSYSSNSQVTTVMDIIVGMSCGMMIFFCVLALIGFAIAVQIVLIHRYYSSFFTDEGYLTFTLPVSTHSLLLSKTVSAVLFSFYACVIEFVCIIAYILTYISCSDGIEAIGQIPQQILDMISSKYGIDYISMFVTYCALFFVGQAVSVMIVYLSFTIGSAIATKHRVLAGVGIYFLITVIMSTIQEVIASVVLFMFDAKSDFLSATGSWMLITMWITIAIMIIVGVVCYFVMHYLLKNKLNLS
ncbi:MAG: hypothetical protein ACI396_00185 [Acutalibacteraceae bacterium]